MLTLLRFFVKRKTLISIRNFLRSIPTKFSFFMASSKSSIDSQQSDEFDPLQPSVPISYPIKTLEDLESRAYFNSFHYLFNKASVPLVDGPNLGLPNRPRLLVCHDMAGGYLDDKWVQGGNNSDAYGIWHWYLMDVFVYFSHNLVTLPPPGWINAAHKHGVKVLGTFITEWDEGKLICNKLLSSKDYAHMCAERLTELAVALGFDGWLINMEVGLVEAQIANLKEFVSHLTNTMHVSKPGSLVIWYDSITVDGELSWQDQLNAKNRTFFDLCDGIFTNYTWKKGYPAISADVAGDRKFDVYMGIDVFGRNTFGGGQWNTNAALEVIKKADVSAAIFAPGWVYETKQPPDFQTAQNRWWALVEESWGVMQFYPRTLPFYSNLDQGYGHHFSINGKEVSSADWNNLSCQSLQPYVEFHEDVDLSSFQVFVDSREESFNGGGNLTFKGDLGHHAYITKRLFLADLLIGDQAVHFAYTVKLDGHSLMGLSLKLTSMKGEINSLLLASHGDTLHTMNQFSSKFNEVIMPHRVTKLDSTEGWILQESAITMPGYTLNEILAVCYMLKPGSKISNKYHAVLGDLSVQSPYQHVKFPPSSSWLVEGRSIKWELGQDKSKSLSLNILWRSKNGNDSDLNSYFQIYHIYAEKIPVEDLNEAEKLEGVMKFLGVAPVQAFYISGLVVPSGISAIKFFIQAYGAVGVAKFWLIVHFSSWMLKVRIY